jgi:hypothetical protein
MTASVRARLLAIGDSILLADWRDHIDYDSKDWTPHPFQIRNIKVGHVNSVRIRVAVTDIDGTITALSKASGGLTGTVCSVYHVVFDAGTWVEDTEYAQIELPIVDVAGQYPEVVLELSAKSGWKRTGGIPMGDRTCRHVFKGVRCQYAGADTTCDRDREHCRVTKSNLANYGGYHFALDAGQTVTIAGAAWQVPSSPTGGRIPPDYLGGDPGTDPAEPSDPYAGTPAEPTGYGPFGGITSPFHETDPTPLTPRRGGGRA